MKLDIDFARDLVSNYAKNHWAFLNGTLPPQSDICPSLQRDDTNGNAVDSRSVWFSIDRLRHFIDEIETHHGNGVRIYFGEYPVTTDTGVPDSRVPDGYGGLHTVVLMPTALNPETGYNCDFDIHTRSSDFSRIASGGAVFALNHGNLMPPPPTEVTSLAASPADGSFDYQGADFMKFVDTACGIII